MSAEGPDLVIAGAGGGLAGALRAAELGLDVLVVELLEKETLDKDAIARIFEPVTKRSSRPVWLSSARRPVSDRPPVVSPRELAGSNGSPNGSNGSGPNGHSNLGGEPTDVGNDLGLPSD